MQGNIIPISIKPPKCERCHHSWWFTKFDWEQGLPKKPDWCPCCISPKYEKPFGKNEGPQEGEEGVLLAYCPACKVFFWSRESWIFKQEKISKSEKNPFLPRRATVKEIADYKERQLETVSSL